MNFYYNLKRKYQRYAISNLATIASVCFAVGYLLMISPIGSQFYNRFLAFYPKAVLHGQIWRIVTAMLYPPMTGGIFNAVLGILIYYSFATSVERTMGDFDFNVYFFGSLLCGELGNIVYYLFTGVNAPFIPIFTHFSMFMAFSIIYAESTILLFFIIPLKAKYIAMFEAAMYLVSFITGSVYTKISIIAAFIPVLLFYLIVDNRRHGGNGDIISNWKFRMAQKKRQKEWRDQWR